MSVPACRVTSAAVLILLLPFTSAAREYGPPEGAKMSSFALQDQDGKVRSLEGLSGPNGVFLIFFRSVDWCPYCKAALIELEQNLHEFRKSGIGVAAISPDSPEQLRQFGILRGISYPLLSDSRSELIRTLGILDDSIPKDSPLSGIPYPCVFVLDARGTIAGKYFEDDRRRRFTAVDVLQLKFGKTAVGRSVQVRSPHLRFSAAIKTSLVTADQRVSVEVDIALEPGVYVYASGKEGCTPLELRIQHSPATPAHQLHYPSSKTTDAGQTYSDHFYLKGYFLLGSHADLKRLADSSGRLKVNAALHFQACDQVQCYPAEELPFHWTLQYAGFDRP